MYFRHFGQLFYSHDLVILPFNFIIKYLQLIYHDNLTIKPVFINIIEFTYWSMQNITAKYKSIVKKLLSIIRIMTLTIHTECRIKSRIEDARQLS